MELIDALVSTHLTRQESQLYIALLREGPQGGYEAAKAASISRSNAYLALGKLVEKGAAHRIEGTPPRYAAVPPEEYVANCRSAMERAYRAIAERAPRRAVKEEPYYSIYGDEQTLQKMRALLALAERTVYLAWPLEDLRQIEDSLREAVGRGLKVVLITDAPYALAGAQVYHAAHKRGRLRLIVDTLYVLTGATGSGGICLYSKNAPLIDLIRDSLIDELRLLSAR